MMNMCSLGLNHYVLFVLLKDSQKSMGATHLLHPCYLTGSLHCIHQAKLKSGHLLNEMALIQSQRNRTVGVVYKYDIYF